MTENRIGGLLLAAGGSTRFGSAKQLAKFRGKTLLRTAAEAIMDSGCSSVVVVLGACADECWKEIAGLDIHPVINSDWRKGMSSSIRSGLNKLLDLETEINGVLITLMDQPLVTAAHLAEFVDRFKRDRPSIIAAQYDDVAGVPALFSQSLFDEILKLGGDRGARSVIRNCPDAITISLPEAATDIDQPNHLSENH